MARPVLLDLFCGAGGAAVGYHRAGFDVVGVDNQPQPHYPFEFHQADAMDVLDVLVGAQHWDIVQGFYAAVHASPPCQDHYGATSHASTAPAGCFRRHGPSLSGPACRG